MTPDARRPASRCAFSCSAVTVDPPQSAEIDLFDDEDLAAAAAAAAMSMVLLDVEALALERLGAMASVRGVLRAGKKGAKGKRNLEAKGTSEGYGPYPLQFIRG